MDFDRGREQAVSGLPCYHYERLDPALLPPVYVAYHISMGEPTEGLPQRIRERYNRGEAAGRRRDDALRLPRRAEGREAILAGDRERLSALIQRETSTRAGAIYNLAPWQIAQVETAPPLRRERQVRGVGRRDRGHLPRLRRCWRISSRPLGAIGSRAFVPDIAG